VGGQEDSATRLRVTLLGAFQVSRGGTVIPVPGARLRGLLVRLALAGGRAVDPGVLVDALWPGERPADPANALQSLVSRLRRMLGAAGVVVQVEGGYRLDVTDADVDAPRFEQLAAAGRDRLRGGDPRAAAALLGEAVALWDGQPGGEPAVVVAVAPAVATRLAQSAVEAGADLAEAELALGRAEAAAARLSALLAEQRVHERAAALLMDALAAQGRQAEALELYERVRAELADRLGADPGAALRERHLRLLRSPAAEPPPGPAPGQHRGGSLPINPAEQSRDESERARDGDGRARDGRGRDGGDGRGRDGDGRGRDGDGRGRDGDGRGRDGDGRGRDGAPPSNLPAQLTSFIGRDDDLTRLDVLLAGGRLVTVLGPGGAGKTRLALEAARRHRHEYRDGSWLVDLASVTEPAKVGGAMLAAIGLRGAALFDGRIRAEGDELDVLADQLAGRESLLVMDNCEHLIDAVAHLIAALLARCAGLRVLATSREPLAVDGEALVPLGPLALPDPAAGVEQVRRAAAVRLFVERAAAVRPGFDVDEGTLGEVLRVVHGLDGMPLALELAAARLRTLSLAELAAGLSDRFRLLTTGSRTAFPRHRTLRAVIAWSWDLLSDHEREVAERVSVLPGGVTPASAAAVCAGNAVPAAEVPELLAALVDRSLLQLAPEPGRYRMLETLREYGIERLAERGTADAVRDLAARYLAELVAQHDPQLRGPGQLAALGVLRAEYDNALAALRHLCDAGDATGAVGLAMDLTWYWQMFGRHADATYWLGEALALPVGEHTLDRDCAQAMLLLNSIRTRSAMPMVPVVDRESELRQLADRLLGYPELPGLAGALTAVTLAFLQEIQAALVVIQRLIDGPDAWLSGLARMFRAQFAENEGDLDQVRTDVAGALECFGTVGDRWGLATTLPMRALLRQYDGDLDGALDDLRRARALAGEFGSLSLSDEVFIDMRWIDLHMRRGDTERAIAMITETRERALRSASPEIGVLITALEAGLWVRLGDLDQARELIEAAEAGMAGTIPYGDHGRAVVGSMRAALCLELGDAAGAEEALTLAYAGAVESGDMPILAMVAVIAAGLAGLRGRYDDVAFLLGAAARLRGTHDRTDLHVRDLVARGRDALGVNAFAEAYEKGWQLDGKTARAQVDPARLRQQALPAVGRPGIQARRA
jgi:predicted ATPase/DNA-binding SARP family transcriptional activator